jgi:hypothetical protein
MNYQLIINLCQVAVNNPVVQKDLNPIIMKYVNYEAIIWNSVQTQTKMQSVSLIKDLTGLDLKGAVEYYERITQGTISLGKKDEDSSSETTET